MCGALAAPAHARGLLGGVGDLLNDVVDTVVDVVDPVVDVVDDVIEPLAPIIDIDTDDGLNVDVLGGTANANVGGSNGAVDVNVNAGGLADANVNVGGSNGLVNVD